MKVKVKCVVVVWQLDERERAGLSIDLGRESRDSEQNFHWRDMVARHAGLALRNRLSKWIKIG